MPFTLRNIKEDLQIGRPSKPEKQAKSVAVACHWLPPTFHGKEGGDGSSPSEGFRILPA